MPKKPKFAFFKQRDRKDCGPACLQMIATYHGIEVNIRDLRQSAGMSRSGTSMPQLVEAADAIGLSASIEQMAFSDLTHQNTPFLIPWKHNHFVLVTRIKRNHIEIADPAIGVVQFSHEDFLTHWLTISADQTQGFAVFFTLNKNSLDKKTSRPVVENTSITALFRYFLAPHQRSLLLILFGIGLASILQFAFPFLTQAIVDRGIGQQDLGFIYLMLLAQIMLVVSQTVIQFIRSWLFLKISTSINFSLLSRFFAKLLNLPIYFFQTKTIGDLLQRVTDHHRIDSFITGAVFSIIYSILTLLVFGVVLLIYSKVIFLTFVIGSIVLLIWIYFFMAKRRVLDNQRFAVSAKNRTQLIETVEGIADVKLNAYAHSSRLAWENNQVEWFKVRSNMLVLNQTQRAGGVLINELKNIVISFLAAKSVIDGDMTLGMMLATQYIISQLNSPVRQIIDFIQRGQDAKISMERISEIHEVDDEAQQSDFQKTKRYISLIYLFDILENIVIF